MSTWGRSGWYERAPKKPPPERGIKMTKAGTTWWGQRWIETLTSVLRGDSARLARGRTYARAGRTHDLVVKGGRVTAKVTGSRATPYKITIELGQLTDTVWKQAILRMVEKAQFAAELLTGQMPKEIDEAFGAAGASLFPKQRTDLKTTCTCPDWGDPCKHVAATHYVLGEALDRDPFLLFELRGRTKTQVLDALRLARGNEGATTAKGRPTKVTSAASIGIAAPDVPKVTLGKLEPKDYDRVREAFPALHFSFDAPHTHGAVLRQLGVPAAWRAEGSPADTLSPMVRRAAEAARRIAMAEPEPQAASDEDEDAIAPRVRRRAKPEKAPVDARGVAKPRRR